MTNPEKTDRADELPVGETYKMGEYFKVLFVRSIKLGLDAEFRADLRQSPAAGARTDERDDEALVDPDKTQA